MNKFKKIMLGALSVLTLGLFVATGAKVIAAAYDNPDGCSKTVTSTVKTYALTANTTSQHSLSNGDTVFDITCVTSSSSALHKSGYLKMNDGSEWRIPVPSDAVGNIKFTATSNNKAERFWTIVKGTNENTDSSGNNSANSATVSFANTAVSGSGENTYVTVSVTGQLNTSEIKVTLTTGSFLSASDAPESFTLNYLKNDGTEEVFATDSVTNTNSDVQHTFTITSNKPTRAGYKFLGWSLSATGSVISEATIDVSLATTSLYAIWLPQITADFTHDYSTGTLDDSYLVYSNVSLNGDKNAIKMQTGTIVSFETSKPMVLQLTCSSVSDGNTLKVNGTAVTISSNNTIRMIIPAGSNKFEKGNGSPVVTKIELFKLNSAVTSSIAAQFDNDEAPTKLRLVGIIEGLKPTEYEQISNVTFTFDFNGNVGNNGNSYTIRCSQLYKSVASLKSDFAAGDYKLYVVLTINGVNKYVESGDKSIENITMTINFEDGTQKVVTRDDVLLAAKA